MYSDLWDICITAISSEIIKEKGLVIFHYLPNTILLLAKIDFQQTTSLQEKKAKQNTHSFGLASTGGGSLAGESKTAGDEMGLSPFGLVLIIPFTP